MSNPLRTLDSWAAYHPWQARMLPLAAWVCFLPLARLVETPYPALLPAVYGAQMLLTGALVWHWRKRFNELSLRFHWLVLPSAAWVFVLWLGLGWFSRGLLAPSWHALRQGTAMPETCGPMAGLFEEQPALAWSILSLRLLGMTLVVPLIEELFFRSAMVCLFPSWRALGRHLARFPLLEDFLGKWIDEAQATPKPEQGLPLGVWTWPGMWISTLLFTVNHRPGDYAAAGLAGLIWCAMNWYCNKTRGTGLGPVILSHALVNAALWGWCVWRGDWAFL